MRIVTSCAVGEARLWRSTTDRDFRKPRGRGGSNPSKPPRPEGSGLGPASARAIARAHGGDIDIEPGPGGRVVVRLPWVDETQRQTRAPEIFRPRD